jgi:hypothetical protein
MGVHGIRYVSEAAALPRIRVRASKLLSFVFQKDVTAAPAGGCEAASIGGAAALQQA